LFQFLVYTSRWREESAGVVFFVASERVRIIKATHQAQSKLRSKLRSTAARAFLLLVSMLSYYKVVINIHHPHRSARSSLVQSFTFLRDSQWMCLSVEHPLVQVHRITVGEDEI